MNNAVPSVLYKYKSFSINSLDSLINDTVYLADPVSFNDPFDCQPSVVDDTNSIDLLREIAHELMFDANEADFDNHEKRVIDYIKHQNGKLLEKIFDSLNPLSLSDYDFLNKENQYRLETKNDYPSYIDEQIQKLTDQIDSDLIKMEEKANITDPSKLIAFYEDLIEGELVKSRNKGVLSLAKNNDCPLMWAHYADDHQGFCCGYRLPGDPDVFANEHSIKAVDYEGDRKVLTSQLFDLVKDLENIKNSVDNTIFFVKAENWLYEREYRMIGKLGLNKSPFILESIYFGLRCKDSVKFSIMSALANRDSTVTFYQMKEVKGTFKLEPKQISLSDLPSLPRN